MTSLPFKGSTCCRPHYRSSWRRSSLASQSLDWCKKPSLNQIKLQPSYNTKNPNNNYQTWIQDLLIQDQDQDQDLLIQDQDQDQDSAVSRPRPRPRLSSFKTKTKTKTCLSKTKTKTKTSMSKAKTETETQDLQDQYWKSMTGMNCDKQKVMASRKSSIPVVSSCTQ